MEPKTGAVALAASSAAFLALGLLTGGPVFHAAFLASIAVLLADGWRCAALRSDLRRRLGVARELSKSEMLPGSDLTITYRFDYRGRRIVRLRCVQAPGGGLAIASPAAALALRPGMSSLAYAATACGRGKHTVPALDVAFESLLFRGSLTAGGAGEVSVYPVVDVRPGRVLRRSLAAPALDEGAVKPDAGIDFSHIRPYVPGDSTRNIDWARSSRHGSPVVKTFEDVRSRPAFVLIDVDVSMEAGPGKTALESAIELATLLAGRVLRENERIGVACFSGSDVTAHLPAASGPRQMTRVRQLLASARAVPASREPRGKLSLLHEAVAAREAFGDANAGLGAVVDEAVRQFTANVKEDGFVKAIFRASRTPGVPCHIVVATNLSMGMPCLLDGARIARYFGHTVTVALAPRVWYEPPAGLDAEKCYRRYREAAESIACLRSHGIDVIELSAAGRPEEALAAGRSRRRVRAVK